MALRQFVDTRTDQTANFIQWNHAIGISNDDEAINRLISFVIRRLEIDTAQICSQEDSFWARELDLSAICLAPWALNYHSHSSALELPRHGILRPDYEKVHEFPLSFPHSMKCELFVKSARKIVRAIPQTSDVDIQAQKGITTAGERYCSTSLDKTER